MHLACCLHTRRRARRATMMRAEAAAAHNCTAVARPVVERDASSCSGPTDPGGVAPPAAIRTVLSIAAAASLSPSEVQQLVGNALAFSKGDTLVVVHWSRCGEEHGASWVDLTRRLCASSRVLLTPSCVSVHRACGSILHAHLLNFKRARAWLDANGARDPAYFVLQASNMRWWAAGWETALPLRAAWTNSSTTRGCLKPFVAGDFGSEPSQADVHRRVLLGLGRLETPAWTGDYPEGAFYSWKLLQEFVPALEAALTSNGLSPNGVASKAHSSHHSPHHNPHDSPLARLDELDGYVEEVYLPSFAVAAAAHARIRLASSSPSDFLCATDAAGLAHTGRMLTLRSSPTCPIFVHSALARYVQRTWQCPQRFAPDKLPHYAYKCHSLSFEQDGTIDVGLGLFALVYVVFGVWWCKWRSPRRELLKP